jgi:hypothetical protein
MGFGRDRPGRSGKDAIHRNQDTKALGKMAFAILKTFINRKVTMGMIEVKAAYTTK